MNDEQSLLSIYNEMISSDKIEKNKSQEKLVSDLEALKKELENSVDINCLLYTSPSPRDRG